MDIYISLQTYALNNVCVRPSASFPVLHQAISMLYECTRLSSIRDSRNPIPAMTCQCFSRIALFL